MKKFILLSLLCTFGGIGSGLKAQQHIPCYTSEFYRLQLQSDPQKAAQARTAEARFNRFAQEFARKRALISEKTSENRIGSKYIIPTVVHVVHSGSGQPDSISAEQVLSAFPHLFDDLRNVPGTRGFGSGADTHFELSLATKDPQGRPSSGITYTRNAEATEVVIDSDSAGIKPGLGNIKLKSLIRWDTTRYCNIWIVKSIRTVSSTSGSIAGYAQYPWYPSPETDGIVVAHRFFGDRGTTEGYTSTTTHEVGHWLALIHPFDSSGKDGCDPGNCLNWGDKVCDLPPTNPTFKQIIFRKNSCNTDAPDKADISRNYMDYSVQDNMPNHYSHGQAVRSIAALENPEYDRKNKLWTDENNQRTGTGSWGPPRANFWVTNRRPCAGSPVTFLDYSSNRPTSYQWTFEGGTPATSTEAYPTVTYSRPGTYRVSLTVNNFSGQSSEAVKNNFITVTEGSRPLPYLQKFERETFPPEGLFIHNPDEEKEVNNLGWERSVLGSGDTSLGCAVMPLYSYNDYGQKDGLVLPTLNFQNVRQAGLTFNLSYRPFIYFSSMAGDVSEEMLYSDSLEIQVSTDCGHTWGTVAKDGGERLMTASEPLRAGRQGTPDRHAQPAGWKKMSVDLSKLVGLSSVQVRFQTVNGWGNHMYLDDISVIPQNVGTTLGRYSFADSKIKVYPNPFSETSELTLPAGETFEIAVIDLTGKTVYRREATEKCSLELSGIPAGVYVLKISGSGPTFYTEKIIKL